MSRTKTTKLIVTFFWVWSRVSPRNHVLGGPNPPAEGAAFLGGLDAAFRQIVFDHLFSSTGCTQSRTYTAKHHNILKQVKFYP